MVGNAAHRRLPQAARSRSSAAVAEALGGRARARAAGRRHGDRPRGLAARAIDDAPRRSSSPRRASARSARPAPTTRPKLGGDYRGGTIGASPAYSFTAHVAEVEVDVETGRITCEKIWVAHDCGRALNPMLVEGQMEGSAYMGFAEALLEEHDVNRFGLHARPVAARLPHPDLARHARARGADRREHRPRGPVRRQGGRRGPAAPGRSRRSPTRSTTRSAIRLRHLPFTPAKVLAALREKRARAPSSRARGARLMLRLPKFELAEPTTVDEALALLAAARRARAWSWPAAPTSCPT